MKSSVSSCLLVREGKARMANMSKYPLQNRCRIFDVFYLVLFISTPSCISRAQVSLSIFNTKLSTPRLEAASWVLYPGAQTLGFKKNQIQGACLALFLYSVGDWS